jgi:hypothetical protein
MAHPTLFEKRRRLGVAVMHHVIGAWVNRDSKVTDPVVLVADPGDAVGRCYAPDAGNVRILIVSAADLSKRLAPHDPIMAEMVRRPHGKSLFLVVCALNGAISAYVNSSERGLATEHVPGCPPGAKDASNYGISLAN